MEEKEKIEKKVEAMQILSHQSESERLKAVDDLKRLQQEIGDRDACEAKVQEYVQTLIAKNEELQR